MSPNPLTGGGWESWLNQYIKRFGRTFLDIGANVGQWSIPLSQWYDRIIGFEPNEDAVKELKQNLPSNMILEEMALWSHTGELTLYLYKHHSHTSAIFDDQGINTGPRIGEIIVPCRKLDYYKLQQVDFIKCDTEGAEVEIIKGGLKTIELNKPDLLIEIHNLQNRQWLEENIPKLGYRYILKHHPGYYKNNPYYEHHLWMRAYPE